MHHPNKCPDLGHLVSMKIIVWNCCGALSPNFGSNVEDLVRDHSPTMMIVTETRVGGDRARAIMDRLSFDGAIHVDTVRYAGGIWLIWNSEEVEVTHLSSTEQEFHALV